MNEVNKKKPVFITDLLLPVAVTGEVISVKPTKPFFDGTARSEVEIEFKTEGSLKTQLIKAKTDKGVSVELGKIYNLQIQMKQGRVRDDGRENEFQSFLILSAVEKKGGAK